MKYFSVNFIIEEVNSILKKLGFKNNNYFGLIIYFIILIAIIFYIIYKSFFNNDPKKIVYNAPSINTVGQTGGINTINIQSSKAPQSFNIYYKESYFLLSSKKYVIAYKLIANTDKESVMNLIIRTDNKTNIESVSIEKDGKVIEASKPFSSPFDQEDRNKIAETVWIDGFLNLPASSLDLKIVLDRKPDKYSIGVDTGTIWAD